MKTISILLNLLIFSQVSFASSDAKVRNHVLGFVDMACYAGALAEAKIVASGSEDGKSIFQLQVTLQDNSQGAVAVQVVDNQHVEVVSAKLPETCRKGAMEMKVQILCNDHWNGLKFEMKPTKNVGKYVFTGDKRPQDVKAIAVTSFNEAGNLSAKFSKAGQIFLERGYQGWNVRTVSSSGLVTNFGYCFETSN